MFVEFFNRKLFGIFKLLFCIKDLLEFDIFFLYGINFWSFLFLYFLGSLFILVISCFFFCNCFIRIWDKFLEWVEMFGVFDVIEVVVVLGVVGVFILLVIVEVFVGFGDFDGFVVVILKVLSFVILLLKFRFKFLRVLIFRYLLIL